MSKYIKEATQIHPKSIKNHPQIHQKSSPRPPDPHQSTLVPQTSLETSIFDDCHLIATSLLSPKSHQKSITNHPFLARSPECFWRAPGLDFERLLTLFSSLFGDQVKKWKLRSRPHASPLERVWEGLDFEHFACLILNLSRDPPGDRFRRFWPHFLGSFFGIGPSRNYKKIAFWLK